MIKLGEIAEIRGRVGWRGYTVADLIDSGPLVIGANEITSDNQLNLTNAKHLTREKYEESPEIFIQRDDILVVKVGSTIGKVCIIDKEIGEASINPNCVIVRATKISPYYLYLYLSSPEGRAFLTNNSSASGQPALNQTTLKKMPVYVPDISVQKKAEEIIYPINHLCELNQSIIGAINLSMRELYVYWFVQFDFPDKNGRPYKTSGGKMVYSEELKREIPKGWGVKTIGDCLNEHPKSKIKVGDIAKDKKGDIPFYTSGEQILSYDKPFSDGFVVFLNTGGNAGVKTHFGRAAYSTDTYCVDFGNYTAYIGQYLKCILPNMDTLFFAGSGLKHLQKDVLKMHKILSPDEGLVKSFNDIAISAEKAISSLIAENNKLAELRDWLLPMLMNGQIKVES